MAGATNAGSFLAVHQYTAHMTGIISSMSDQLALGNKPLLMAGLGALLSFLAGAACSAILINWARRKHLHSEYALPLLLEAFLLLCFGMLGACLSLRVGLFIPATVMLLCFIMGLQNAIITKISRAQIRTTHVTGLVTDIGIELGKLFYCKFNHSHPGRPFVLANRKHLGVLTLLLSMFFVGGVVGAFGFKQIGFATIIPLAVLLLMLAVVPVVDDVRKRLRHLGALPRSATKSDAC